MYKELLESMLKNIDENTAREVFTKLSAEAGSTPSFDPKKPIDPDKRMEITSLEEKLDKYFETIDKNDDKVDSVNGKIFKSDHEARSYLRANGFNKDSLGNSWIKGTTVAHIIFKREDRFKSVIDARHGYEIITQ